MATLKRDVRLMGVREFRDAFPTLDEQVRVIRSRRPDIEVLGTWTPNPRRSDMVAKKESQDGG